MPAAQPTAKEARRPQVRTKRPVVRPHCCVCACEKYRTVAQVEVRDVHLPYASMQLLAHAITWRVQAATTKIGDARRCSSWSLRHGALRQQFRLRTAHADCAKMQLFYRLHARSIQQSRRGYTHPVSCRWLLRVHCAKVTLDYSRLN